MKFEISRGSTPGRLPCPEAIEGQVGTNINGAPIMGWTIQVDSLEDLKAFAESVDEHLNISFTASTPHITIYDCYLE